MKEIKKQRNSKIELSVIIPVYNEEESLVPLQEKLFSTLVKVSRRFEIIYVDDGSTDKSFEILQSFAKKDRRVKVLKFRKNFGQTAAIAAGMDCASGEVIVPMDADLQNDPEDISKLLEKIREGYDVVSGWRKNRKDPFFTRILPSSLANWLISWFSGVKLHDYGCTLKAYKREIMKDVHLYGEMHRFIPIFAYLAGAKVAEMPVTHHPRQFGKSKYGLIRTFKVLLDLLTVKFLLGYSTKPIYVFGGFGIILCCLGAIAGIITLYEKFALDVFAHRNPMLLLGTFLFLLGVQSGLMGLLAELLIRTYYETQKKSIYAVKETRNL